MEEQRTRARASWKGGHKDVANPAYAKLAETFRTEPDFYFGDDARRLPHRGHLTKDGAVNELPPGAEGEIVLDRTPFYAESGGQVADIGTLWNNEHTLQLAEVRGAYYPVSGLDRAPRCRQRKTCRGRSRGGRRRRRAARAHQAQSHGDAPDARRAAQYSGHARQAGRLAGRAGAAALRLFAFRRDGSGGTARHRAAGERPDSAQLRDRDRRHHAGRRAGFRRAGVFRRPLSRSRTCAW